MKAFLDESLIPTQYGGFSTNFKHMVYNYSFDDSDLSTYESSSVQKPNVFVTSSFAYDVQQIEKLKQKIAFVEANVEEIVSFIYEKCLKKNKKK